MIFIRTFKRFWLSEKSKFHSLFFCFFNHYWVGRHIFLCSSVHDSDIALTPGEPQCSPSAVKGSVSATYYDNIISDVIHWIFQIAIDAIYKDIFKKLITIDYTLKIRARNIKSLWVLRTRRNEYR